MKRGWVLRKVISGGQTGVDQVALKVAKELGYETGGVAPKGFRTDAGPNPSFAALYGVQAHTVSKEYAPRTRENVRNSDATVIFDAEAVDQAAYYDGRGSGGCRLTWKYCIDLKKLYIVNPTVEELQQFILRNEFEVLNVAGNRSRTHPESAERAEIILRRGLLPF